jgi:hypothetical protein
MSRRAVGWTWGLPRGVHSFAHLSASVPRARLGAAWMWC